MGFLLRPQQDGCPRPADVLVSQQLLNRADVRSVHQQVSSEGMPERVRRDVLVNSRLEHGFLQMGWESSFVQVMPVQLAASRIARQAVRREQVLPFELAMSVRELAV